MAVTVWEISERERDGHGKSCEIPLDENHPLREKRRKEGKNADLLRCAPWIGMAKSCK